MASSSSDALKMEIDRRINDMKDRRKDCFGVHWFSAAGDKIGEVSWVQYWKEENWRTNDDQLLK